MAPASLRSTVSRRPKIGHLHRRCDPYTVATNAAEGGVAMRICLLVLFGLLLVAKPIAQVPATASAPTFHKDVLPILQRNCQACHRPGEIAPMSLLTFDQTRPWARAIKTAVTAKTMPPWFADANYGHFENERRLTSREIATINAWVDAGAPAGREADAPPPLAFENGWNIKPDV